jgi:threonine/homoserine/homoserine lactone efflux protein
MISLASLVAFVPVAVVLTVTPGTDTMLVLRTAGLAGARSAALAAAGIALGCLVWGLAVALGLGALLVASPVAFGWLRLAGAAYLAWIGIGLIVRPHRPGAPGGPADNGWTAFRRGLLTNLLNPKVGVFYLTLFPQFLPSGTSDPVAGLVLAGVQIAMTLVWFAGLIAFARSLAPILSSPVFARRIDRVCGVIFLGFGLKLALANR